MTESTKLTPKAIQTRQHILDSALALFASKGYEATTMRDIADSADCSLGLAYRYFERKEMFVLALYEQMSTETVALIETLEDERLEERFHMVMLDRLEMAKPYRDAIGALFGAVVSPGSSVSLWGEDAVGMRSRAQTAFQELVKGASPRPPEPTDLHLASMLYSVHFLFILFWLIDRTPNQQATTDLLNLTREGFTMVLPTLKLPFMRSAIERLAGILERVF